MVKEVDPKDTSRAVAYELWMKATKSNGDVFQDSGCNESC